MGFLRLEIGESDIGVLERLTEEVQNQHPTQSRDWCVAKVIRELERDRK